MDVSLESSVESARSGRGRRTAFTVVTILLALASAFFLFGIGVLVGWFDNDMHGIHRVHDVGFGILFGVLLTTALVSLVRRPEAKASSMLAVFAIATAVLLATILSTDSGVVAPAIALFVAAGVLVALHPDRASILRTAPRPSGPMLAVVGVGAVPLVAFALTLARLQRTGPPHDPHVSMNHWAVMAAMVLGVLLCAALASLRLPGWRVTAWSSGTGVAVYGVSSIVFRHFPGGTGPYPGSRGAGWGVVAVVGGALFVAVSERVAR